MHRIRPGTLAGIFFRAGTTIFGGGDPTVAALQREFVERRNVMSQEEFGILFALARITPGTNMVAFCAGSGYLLSGWIGAVIAVVGVTLPPAVIAVLLLESFDRLMTVPVAAAGIGAMVAAAVGLMFAAALQLLRPHVSPRKLLRTSVLAGAAFLLIWKDLLSPLTVLILAAVAGYLWPEPAAQ